MKRYDGNDSESAESIIECEVVIFSGDVVPSSSLSGGEPSLMSEVSFSVDLIINDGHWIK